MTSVRFERLPQPYKNEGWQRSILCNIYAALTGLDFTTPNLYHQ
jgi:hypothetical protein